MNIDELTLGQIKEIGCLLGNNMQNVSPTANNGLSSLIGKYVIIRTYSAGVHAGVLKEKAGTEVILEKSRRLWSWWAKESVSLSSVAKYGINQNKSKIAPSVGLQWLDAIEIIPCEEVARKSIEDAKEQKQN